MPSPTHQGLKLGAVAFAAILATTLSPSAFEPRERGVQHRATLTPSPGACISLTGKAKRAMGEALLRAHSGDTVPPFSPFPQPMPPDCGARVEITDVTQWPMGVRSGPRGSTNSLL